MSKLLQYNPSLRLKPFEALAHTFFDELREPNLILPNGKAPPPLFNFLEIGKMEKFMFCLQPSEQKAAAPYLSKLIPKHAEHQLQATSHTSSQK